MLTKDDSPVTPEIKSLVEKFIARVSPKYPAMISAMLYGPYAKGDEKSAEPLQLALLLNSPKGALFEVTSAEFNFVAHEFALDFHVQVKPTPIWMEEWETPTKYAQPDLITEINNNGVSFAVPKHATFAAPEQIDVQ